MFIILNHMNKDQEEANQNDEIVAQSNYKNIRNQ
jgi:hypothetical protein